VLQGVACVNYVFLAIRRTKEDAMRKVVLQCVAVCCSVLQCFACVIHVFLAIRRTKGDAMRKVVSLDDLKRVTTSIEELQESVDDVAGM